MAFDRDNLIRIGGANSGAKALWMYASEDDAYAAIGAADYFLEALVELKLDDTLIVTDSSNVHTITYVSDRDTTSGSETISVAAGNTITA